MTLGWLPEFDRVWSTVTPPRSGVASATMSPCKGLPCTAPSTEVAAGSTPSETSPPQAAPARAEKAAQAATSSRFEERPGIASKAQPSANPPSGRVRHRLAVRAHLWQGLQPVHRTERPGAL